MTNVPQTIRISQIILKLSKFSRVPPASILTSVLFLLSISSDSNFQREQQQKLKAVYELPGKRLAF
ncbi:hypothetical protein HOLleu_38040 [Holothuria leucospilota]|uniref:Uncharacterized protein n=1 Tax=Holothuria leucospilota TaxID=206669 RepID=A0A9Q0YI68_HOLLE|nr:hypothetical protein HOLleu_38040 [Holothuria leucospilota]